MKGPLRSLYDWRRPALTALAGAFAAWTLVYTVSFIVASGPRPGVELGFNAPTFLPERALLVERVYPGSPAERAGMLPGDRITSIDGKPLVTRDSLGDAWGRHRAGEAVTLTIDRPGTGTRLLIASFRPAPAPAGSPMDRVAAETRIWVPVPFVLIGLAVLFLRLEDRNAWLLALLFGSCTTITGFSNDYARVAPAVRDLVKAYQSVFVGLLGPLFYWFFAVFPLRSPIDRRLPWLKYAAVAFGLWLAALGLRSAQPLTLPTFLSALLRDPRSSYGPFWFEFAFLTFGLVALAVSFSETSDTEAKRKMRVVFWGTLAGMAPGLLLFAAENLLRFKRTPFLDAATAIALTLFPLSFAYAVVKHRVLEIPVLLKRSVRYLLVQRGFAVLLSLVSISLTLLFAFALAARLQPFVDVRGPSGIVLGAVFGTAVLRGGLRVHRDVSEKIDRVFFRRAYDARVILEDLADQARAAQDRHELAELLEHHLTDALEPAWLTVYLAGTNGSLHRMAGGSPSGLDAIPADMPVLGWLAEKGEPREWPVAAVGGGSVLAAMRPECLVPLLGRERRLAGLLVLGARLSEEPYSGEDKRLLASVAGQAGMALDNIRFAEEIAERNEHERRVAREMEIARDVQRRLLPQAPPALATVDCAARCVQARAVGGDYYDFLDLGHGRVGFVLADVSGKGVHAALLSASLQAHLRSQAALAPLHPARLLCYVNDVLWKSTAPQHYATLFLGLYDDAARRMTYVNCGHNPPVLLRSNGCPERLRVTAPVVGLFEQWACTSGDVEFGPEDVLAIFSDGITEATHGEEEYGEGRLIDRLNALAKRPAEEIVAGVLDDVQTFRAGDQSDDLTLVVVKSC